MVTATKTASISTNDRGNAILNVGKAILSGIKDLTGSSPKMPSNQPVLDN